MDGHQASAVRSPADITQLRIRLRRKGYQPLPITAPGHPIKNAGKAPSLPQWRQRAEQATEADIAAWSSDQGVPRDTNTGLLCGSLSGIDIDIMDPGIAGEMMQLAEKCLGATPFQRTGQAPKCLLVYGANERGVAKMTTPEMVLPDGSKAQVEVLGEGQQFVAYGVHPGTMKPYAWGGASPEDTPLEELPVVTREDLERFIRKATQLLQAKGAVTRTEWDRQQKASQQPAQQAVGRGKTNGQADLPIMPARALRTVSQGNGGHDATTSGRGDDGQHDGDDGSQELTLEGLGLAPTGHGTSDQAGGAPSNGADAGAQQHGGPQGGDGTAQGQPLAEMPADSTFFARVNRAALDNIEPWVCAIFPTARFQPGTDAWRVSSADLARDLQEDLSVHPNGVQDFGSEKSQSPIDVVITWGPRAGIRDGAPIDARTAALWLCQKLNIDPVTLGYNDAQDEVAAIVAEMNKTMAVSHLGGTTSVVTEKHDPARGQKTFTISRTQDIEQLYRNKQIVVGRKKDDTPITKSAGALWLSHPQRRTFTGGIVFDPRGGHSSDTFNLWTGFAVTPRKGNWNLLEAHMRDVICAGNDDHYQFLRKTLARWVRRPWEQGEIAIVMRGGEGVGKGVLAQMLLQMFGRHGLQIWQAKHLTGQFNGHLLNTVLVYADEAFFAGDRAAANVLKGMITEKSLMIEPKRFTPFSTDNRLHVIMASNASWVVPAGHDSRRYFVLDVLNTHQRDRDYFNSLFDQMFNHDGIAAMLWDLQHEDLGNFDHRDIPITKALTDQRVRSLPTHLRWWLDCLTRGYVWESQHGADDVMHVWQEIMPTQLLKHSYDKVARAHREHDPLNETTFGIFIKSMSRKQKDGSKKGLDHVPVSTMIGESHAGGVQRATSSYRPPGYNFGTLDDARAEFGKVTGLQIDWDNAA